MYKHFSRMENIFDKAFRTILILNFTTKLRTYLTKTGIPFSLEKERIVISYFPWISWIAYLCKDYPKVNLLNANLDARISSIQNYYWRKLNNVYLWFLARTFVHIWIYENTNFRMFHIKYLRFLWYCDL